LILLITGAAIVGLQLLEQEEPHEFASVVLAEPNTLPDIHLVTGNGEHFALSEASSDLVLVYFGYTHCPDVCPLTLFDLRAALEQLPENRRDDVAVVMVTVDPERDTPEVMERYVGHFDQSFLGLSGSPDEVHHVLESWGVHVERGEVSEEGWYFMSHPAGVYVLDSQQRLRLVIPPELEPALIADDLLHLLRSG